MGLETYWATDPSEVLRVRQGFRLEDVEPRGTPGFEGNKAAAAKSLAEGAAILADLQEKLFAGNQMGDDPRRILLVLQAMDTAGKGGIVKHVMSAVDPQGVQCRLQEADRRGARARLPLAHPQGGCPRAA